MAGKIAKKHRVWYPGYTCPHCGYTIAAETYAKRARGALYHATCWDALRAEKRRKR